MEEELVFQERQYFKKWKAAIFFVFINTPFVIGFIIQIILGKQWGNNPMSNMMLLIIMLIIFLFSLCFFFVRLDTVIDKDGVYVQMFPVQWKFNFTPWDCVLKAEIRKMNPFFLGGGGWLPTYQYSRYKWNLSGFKRKSLMAIISGNKVLQLDIVNNERIVIGTQRPEELSEVLEKLNAERK